MIDLIERQAAIDIASGYCGYCHPASIAKELAKLPSAQPERKTGHWETYIISMLDGEGCRCSECGSEGVPYWSFCPHCGADMRDEQNEKCG